MASSGTAVVLIGCNIHATEIASSQMSMELAYDLVTSTDPTMELIRERVVILLVPSLNPDAQIVETDYGQVPHDRIFDTRLFDIGPARC